MSAQSSCKNLITRVPSEIMGFKIFGRRFVGLSKFRQAFQKAKPTAAATGSFLVHGTPSIRQLRQSGRLIEGTVPIGGGGGVLGAARAARGAIGRALGRATTNPLAGATGVRSALNLMGGRSAGVAASILGGTAVYSGLTGQKFAPSLKKTALISSGVGVGGIPALLGGGISASTFFAKKFGASAGAKGRDLFTNARKIETDYRSVFPNLPSTNYAPETVFNMTAPSAPAVSSGDVFAPSVSAGGGGGDMLPLLLALAAGSGGLGYLLGRKRRKKRKRKKYKRGYRR